MNLEWRWQQENNELRKALMYYADSKNYKLYGMSGIRRVPIVEVDGGAVARKALEEFDGGFDNRNYAAGE